MRAEYAALALEPDDAPLVEARRRAASRLIALLAARVDREGVTDGPAGEAPTVARLPGTPPYSTLDLDRLRDQLDGFAAQREALALLAKTVQAEFDSAVATRRDTQEALRLAAERESRAREGPDAKRARDALQLAKLESRVAELEVLRTDAARAGVLGRLEALQGPIVQAEESIGRARGAQRIDDRVIDAVRQAVDDERRRIAAERAALAQQAAELGSQVAPGSQVAHGVALERVAGTLRNAVLALGELDAVEAGRVDVWDQRRAALAAASDEAGARRAARALSRSIEQALAHRQAVAARIEVLESEARVQRARVAALAPDSPGRDAEHLAVAALQRELDVQARLRDTLQRYVVLLERSRADLGGERSERQSLTGRVGEIAERFADLGRSVWEYELFSASETLQVDGRTVSVDYGVTVGKSIGVVVLFALGWWLAARIARRSIDLLIVRGKVSPQLGRVLHGWIMTTLLLAVLIVVLKLARVPLTAFAFLGGALAIGVGFGTQNLIKNLISGIIILFERKIRVGDVVTIGGASGTVAAVDLRATTVRGFDGIESILPNSYLLENQVSDWSHGAGQIRGTILVPVAHGADVAETAACILACARAHASVLAEPAPEVLFDQISQSGLVFKLWYWFRLGGERSGPAIASDLNFAIERGLRQRSVALARTLHDVRIDVVGPVAIDSK